MQLFITWEKCSNSFMVERPRYFMPKPLLTTSERSSVVALAEEPSREEFHARWWPGEDISDEQVVFGK